jgi:hypothetical protein
MAQCLQHQPADLVVVQPAGGGDHQFLRAVVAPVMVPDGVPGHRLDRLRGAADRPAERMPGQHRRYEHLVADVGGIVIVHGDFFQDDGAFLLQFLRIQHGGGDHVRDDVDGHRQVRIQHPRIVAGAFLRGGRV